MRSALACVVLLTVAASASATVHEKPAPGAIMFASTRSVHYGAEDVFTIDRRGRKLNLTQTVGIREEALDLSPDGREVLVHRTATNGDQDLYLLDLASRRLQRLTSTPAQGEPTARFSPNGEAVAFIRDEQPNRADLWIVDRAGSERRLTFDGTTKGAVAWSPDGRKLAFADDRALFVVERAGGDPRRLASFPHSLASPHVVWRRDGILVPDERPNGVFDLRLIAEDGQGSRLVRNPCGDAVPAWSPDGSHVVCHGLIRTRYAFVRTAGGRLLRLATLYPPTHSAHVDRMLLAHQASLVVFSAHVDERDADLWLSDGRLRKLTTGPGEDHDPAWSPDRRRVAFVRSSLQRRSGDPGRLMLLDVGRGRVRPLRPGLEAAEPDWSPDGRSLVYERGGDLFVERLGNGSPRRLTRGRAEDTNPTWSGDGATIAFVRQGRRAELSTVPARGGRRTVLYSGARDVVDPAWSPNGRAIAFSTLGTVDVIQVASRRVRTLVRDPDNPLTRPSWSQDGRSLVYAAGWENDIPYPFHAPNAHFLELWRVGLADRSTRPLIRSVGFNFDPDVAR
jgi:Tol biopolymer transport system component